MSASRGGGCRRGRGLFTRDRRSAAKGLWDRVRRASDRQARAGRRPALDAARDTRAARPRDLLSRVLRLDDAGRDRARARARRGARGLGEGGNLQWVPEPRFAAWLAPRLAAADLVHAHMFGAW